MCACGHGARASDGEHRSVVPASSSACSSLRTALREGWKLSWGRGGLRLNKKGQQSCDVITAFWGQGEIRLSWLVNNWAETGLRCCQQVAFTAARILHAMRVAAIVRLGTRAPPEVFPHCLLPLHVAMCGQQPASMGCPGVSASLRNSLSLLCTRCWGMCRISPRAFPSDRYYVAIIKGSRSVFIPKCQRKGRILTRVLKPGKWRYKVS